MKDCKTEDFQISIIGKYIYTKYTHMLNIKKEQRDT